MSLSVQFNRTVSQTDSFFPGSFRGSCFSIDGIQISPVGSVFGFVSDLLRLKEGYTLRSGHSSGWTVLFRGFPIKLYGSSLRSVWLFLSPVWPLPDVFFLAVCFSVHHLFMCSFMPLPEPA